MSFEDERRDAITTRRAARARGGISSNSRGQDAAASSAHDEGCDEGHRRELVEPIGSDIDRREDEGQ